MSVYFNESRETIDLLRRIVDKLDERNGHIRAEDLWNGVQCVPAHARSSVPTVSRHGIRQMEEFSDVLQSFTSKLVSTYKTHTSTTRECIRIPRLSIESLPDEIIHHIVKDAFDCWDPLQLVRYTHISPRLRTVVLGSSTLWASIPLTLDKPTRLLEAITSRSGSLKLTVNICISGTTDAFSVSSRCKLSTDSVLSRFSVMFDHHRRWRDLTFAVTESPAKLIQEHFPYADLSSVRVLGVRYTRFDADFFQEWKLPPLEQLGWDKPSSLPPSSLITRTLRDCTLRIVRDDSDLTSIAAFLNAATSLRSLKLYLNCPADSEPSGVSEIRLTCLEHLEMDFPSISRIGPNAILLRAIVCPGLKHLSLSASTHAEYCVVTENMRERYPMLTSFTLVIAKRRPEEDFFFDEVMHVLPNMIKELKIEQKYDVYAHLRASRRTDRTPVNLSISYTNLTSLDLRDCTLRPEGSFYMDLSKILKAFRVSLYHFRPSRRKWANKAVAEQEGENAILTLQRAGVMVDLTSTP